MVSDQEFRDLMAGVCSPVTVVTAMEQGSPCGTTVGAFASLSLHPPMVTAALDRRSGLLDVIRRRGVFGVNVLGRGQEGIALRFARRGIDRFADVEWRLEHGLPRLADAPGWMACRIADLVEGGDHLLVLGTVEACASGLTAPLVYAHRTFGTHSGFELRPRRPITEQIAALAR
ncbi:flavin reductase [Streptomyces sp. NPDC008092]|uniref:flavin reductase family protein n=1 Tax=Streptomyces sp. NPDC008092 TaxID=3364808 RepID=UPI0036DFEE42